MLIATFGTLSLLFSGCLKDGESTPTPASSLTIVNAYTPSEAILAFNEHNAITQTPIAYREYWSSFNSYIYIFPGERRLTIKSLENSEAHTILDTLVTFRDSTFYTSLVYGTQDDPKQIITTDKVVESLEEEESAIRFFNLSEVTEKVSVFINDEEVFSGYDKETEETGKEHAKFIASASGELEIIVKSESGEVIAERSNFNFLPGSYYSLILTGDPELEGNGAPYIGIIRQGAN